MTYDEKRDLFDTYRSTRKRLLLLDYDGTLVPFQKKPEDAEPDNKLKDLLKELNYQRENEVILISGRDSFTLDAWFSDLDISMVAEHGALFKRNNTGWTSTLNKQPAWKNNIIAVFERFRALYPGSIVEAKTYSVAFHYRQVESNIRELKQRIVEELMMLKAKFDFSIVNGSMVIEVKSKGISKGNFVTQLLDENYFDFVLALGDDATDEDMFKALGGREICHTIKVGIEASEAKCNLINVNNVLSFLEQLTQFKGLGYYR
jgi:trehalose 6-phosphate synthase/phosphatase